MPLWYERHRWTSWKLPDLHLAPVLVLPGEHTLLLHQHLPKGPHFLPDLFFGVPGGAKTWSGLLWLEHRLPMDLLRNSLPLEVTHGPRGQSKGEVA